MSVVRYLVHNVDEAIAFYTDLLNFELGERWGSAFAKVSRKDLTLWLSGPETSAARPMLDGRVPEAGGWNRLVIELSNLEDLLEELRSTEVVLRSEIIEGPGGRQVLIEDPSGNPVELFEAS